jgi:hypothetical protein
VTAVLKSRLQSQCNESVEHRGPQVLGLAVNGEDLRGM